MKILLVSPYDYSYPSGVNHHILKLGENFIRMGHEVKFVFPTSRPQIPPEENINFIGQPTPVHASGSIARSPVSPKLFFSRRINECLDREKFDIVHLHEPLFPSLTTGFLDRSPTVNIGTFHATRSRSWGYRLWRPLLKRWFARLDGKIAVSKAALDFISHYFPGDYTIIPNGVEAGFFSDVSPIEKFRDGKVNILFVGRLEKRKGLHYLLEAYRWVKRKNPQVRLLVVGPAGSALREYELWVKRNGLEDVIFSGHVPFEELLRYYHTADIFCSPATENESFGIVLLEAMAASKPVVASDIPGYANLVGNGVQGLLVRPRDVKMLAETLDLLIKDRGLRERLGMSGRQKAEQHRWERIAERVMAFYESVLQAEKRPKEALLPSLKDWGKLAAKGFFTIITFSLLGIWLGFFLLLIGRLSSLASKVRHFSVWEVGKGEAG